MTQREELQEASAAASDPVPDASMTPGRYQLVNADARSLANVAVASASAIVVSEPVNNARYVNKCFEAVNRCLDTGGTFVGCAETTRCRKRAMRKRFGPLFLPIYTLDYCVHRVLPKLKLTRRLYFAVTGGKYRVMSRTEVLGRLVSCGFEIVSEHEGHDRLCFTVRKKGPPLFDRAPTYGLLVGLCRVGVGGRPILVYKLRTMHPYAEYLQSYVYDRNRLAKNGKFRADFRVTTVGRLLRRTWLDEIPMLLNWVRGDLKLVGVRPLSQQYLSLYPAEFAERRKRYKPGVLPPYYADLPEEFDEIVESERRYLDAYDRGGFWTDCRYLGRIVYNILLKSARSQ